MAHGSMHNPVGAKCRLTLHPRNRGARHASTRPMRSLHLSWLSGGFKIAWSRTVPIDCVDLSLISMYMLGSLKIAVTKDEASASMVSLYLQYSPAELLPGTGKSRNRAQNGRGLE